MAKEFIKVAQKAINDRIQRNKKVVTASCGVDVVGGELYFWMQHENIKTFPVSIDEDLILDEKSVDDYLDVLLNDFGQIITKEMGL